MLIQCAPADSHLTPARRLPCAHFLGGIAASLLLASMIVSGQTGAVCADTRERIVRFVVRRAGESSVDRGHGRRHARTRGSQLPRGRRGRRRPVLARTQLPRPLERRHGARDGRRSVEAARAPGRAGRVSGGPDPAPAGRRSAGRRRRSRDGDQDDRRRHRAERARAVGPRREGRRDRHGHRLQPPGSRRLLRSRLPRREGLRLRRRRVQLRPDATRPTTPCRCPTTIPTTATATART